MDESPDDLVDTMRADIRYAENTGAQKIHSAQPVFFCSLSFVLCTSWYVFAPQVFFRSGKHYFTGKTPEFGIDWEEADWAFHHINEPKARVIIKKYRITHTYIPGQFNIRKEKDKYKIYEKYAESPYVGKVFSSVQNDSPAYIFKAQIYEVVE